MITLQCCSLLVYTRVLVVRLFGALLRRQNVLQQLPRALALVGANQCQIVGCHERRWVLRAQDALQRRQRRPIDGLRLGLLALPQERIP